jgi:hypothetical protein
MVDEVKKLEFIDSVHEQREFQRQIVPCIGAWVETGKFTPVIESWDLKERFFCRAAILDEPNMELIVTLEKLDHEAMTKEAEILADQIIAKHGDLLYNSLKYMICKGIVQNRAQIERTMRLIDNPKYKKMVEMEYEEKLKVRIARAEKTLKNSQEALKAMQEGGITWESKKTLLKKS